ncbi:MAG: hypothetical protein ACRDFC_02585 [Ignavibacteria bacterium]
MINNTKFFISTLTIILSFIFISCGKDKTDKTERSEDKRKIDSIEAEKKDQYRMAEAFTDNKSQIIDLIQGPATFEIKYEGDSNFVAKLISKDGNIVEVLTDVRGPYRGTKTIQVQTTASYILDVKCKGNWSIYRK